MSDKNTRIAAHQSKLYEKDISKLSNYFRGIINECKTGMVEDNNSDPIKFKINLIIENIESYVKILRQEFGRQYGY